jgi:hypothetical protein
MRADAEQQAKVDAERPDIGPGLAGDPEHGEVPVGVVLEQLALVDGPHPELALDGGDERGPLEHGAGERLERAGDAGGVGDGGVEARDADVLLAGALLRLDEAGGAVDADDEVAGDLGVERAAVAGLVDAEEALDPGDDLVRGGVGGLVEVDDAVAEVLGDGALERRVAGGERGVVAGADVEAVVVLEEERPCRGVEGGDQRLRLDEVAVGLRLRLGEGRRVDGGGGGGVLVVEPDEAACERGRGGGRRRWPLSGTTRRCRTYSLKPCAGEGAAGAGAIIMPSMQSVALIERACSAQQQVKRSKTASSRANLLLLLSETE